MTRVEGARRKFWRLQILFVCFFGVLAAYVVMGKIDPSIVGKIKTVDAKFGRVDTELKGTAFVLRRDEVLGSPAEGRLTLLTSSYRSVRAGDLLAEIDPGGENTPGHQQAINEHITESFYLAERERLEDSERDLRVRLIDAERVMRDAIAGGDQTILKEAETRRNDFVVELGYVETLLTNLEEKWVEREKETRNVVIGHPTGGPGQTTIVTAPSPGIVVTTFDGWEEHYVPGRPLQMFDPGERPIKATKVEDGLTIEVGDPIVRISRVDDIEIIVMLHSYLLERGTRVTVKLGQDSEHFVTATVTEVLSKDESTIIRLRVDNFNDVLLDIRRSEVTLTAAAAQGIIVSTSSVVERGGKRGVYMMLGDQPIFREVRILGGNEKETVVDGVQGVPVGAPIVANPGRIK